MADDVRVLDKDAVRAIRAGDLPTASTLLQRALQITREDLGVWMNVAAVRWMSADLTGAGEALEEALRIDPRCFLALLMKASLVERLLGLRAAGALYDAALSQAPPESTLDPTSQTALARARDAKARYDGELATALAGALEGGSDPVGWRGQAFIDYSLKRRRRYEQQPVQFYYPGLPAIEYWDRNEFPWIAELEAAAPRIAAELAGVLGDAEGFVPYVSYPEGVPLDQWRELNRSPRWSAYHLLEAGLPVPGHAERCPSTVELLSHIPQPRVQGRSPVAMFSVLRPHTRIPPHTGIANTRLVVHLPLVVPPGCGFRVGSQTREWRVGEAWVFDDTIEHEAWNDSDQNRTILIFDVWNPRLDPVDRETIAKVTAAMDVFHGTTGAGTI